MDNDKNKLEIEITKDIGNIKADKHNMSLKALKALNVVMEQFAVIADNSDNDGDDIRFDPGTTKVALQASEEKMKLIEEHLTDASEGKVVDDKIFNAWNKVHSVISANGLHYNAKIVFQDKTSDLNPIFTDKKNFKKPKVVITQNTYLKFCVGSIKGMMETVKHSNLYLDVSSSSEPLRFTCSEQEIEGLSKFYKKKVYLSLWETAKGDKILGREFCDIYSSEEYEEYYNFHVEFKKQKKVERLEFIYDAVDDAINKEDNLNKVNKLLKLFENNNDVGVNRILLNALKQIDNEESIKSKKEAIIKKIEDKIGTIN